MQQSNFIRSPAIHRPHHHPNMPSSMYGFEKFLTGMNGEMHKKFCVTKLALWFKAFKEIRCSLLFLPHQTPSKSGHKSDQFVLQKKTCCRCV